MNTPEDDAPRVQQEQLKVNPPTSTPTSRSVAADALTEFERSSEYADDILGRHLSHSTLRGSDRTLAADLFWGSIRWRGRLDSVIAPIFNGDFVRANPLIRTLLRMGAYQIFCQDRIPDHAAVSQTVEIAVNKLGKPAAGLVNAILRRLARERERWTTPPEGSDEMATLVFLQSHPRWIVRELTDLFGHDDAAKALEANNSRAPLTITINTLSWSSDDLIQNLKSRALRFDPSRLLDGYFRLDTSSIGQIQSLLDGGRITVQDESAGLAVALLAPEPGERVLDLCAAPGGKTIAIYQRMKSAGQIVAVEESQVRCDLLKENMNRVGATEVQVLNRDARQLKEDLFDRVIADVPCSSLGLLRKRPDVRWRRKAHQLPHQNKLQIELISKAAELTKPGGVLVYSTCSIMPSENHEIVDNFLKLYPEFHVEDARGFLPESVVGARGEMETYTHIHGTDGAFAARFRRAMTA